jgi:hypothetical protein
MEQVIKHEHPIVFKDRLNRKWMGTMNVFEFKDGKSIIILESGYFNAYSVFSYDHSTGNLIKLPPEDSVMIIGQLSEIEDEGDESAVSS